MEMMMKVQMMMIKQRLSWWQWSQKLGWRYTYPHLHNIHRLQEQQLRIDSQQKKNPSSGKIVHKKIFIKVESKSLLCGEEQVLQRSVTNITSILHCLVTPKKMRGGPQCTFSLVTVAQVFTSSSTPPSTILKKQKTFIEHLFLSNSYTGVYLLMMQPVWHCTYCNFVLFREVFNFDQPHKYFIQLFWRRQSEFWQFILQIYFINDREYWHFCSNGGSQNLSPLINCLTVCSYAQLWNKKRDWQKSRTRFSKLKIHPHQQHRLSSI